MAIIVIFFSFLFWQLLLSSIHIFWFCLPRHCHRHFHKQKQVSNIFTSSATPSSSPDWQLPSFFQQSALNHQFVKYFVNNNIKPRSVSNNPARLVQFFLQGDNIVGQPAHHSSSLVSLYHSALLGLSNYLAVKYFVLKMGQRGKLTTWQYFSPFAWWRNMPADMLSLSGAIVQF